MNITKAQGITTPRKYLQDADLGDLMRFQETTDDGEGYDIGEASIARLSELGCLERHGRGKFSITVFGSFVLEHMFSQDPELPLMTDTDRSLAVPWRKP